jgi:membrane protein implicated in regulation of membrane protease activity
VFAPLIWLVVALGLFGAEAMTGHLFMLMLGGGALAAAGTSWVISPPVWVDGAVFLVVSVLLLAVVRPALRTRLTPREALPSLPKALEGKRALVLDRVARDQGLIKLDGEQWTARPMDDNDVYEPGDQVTVLRIDGATAVVFKN